MRRIAVIVSAWLGLLLAATAGYVWLADDIAVARGMKRYAYRESLKQQLRDAERDHPVVVWVGDSTMIGLGAAAYPQLVSRTLPNTSWIRIALVGSDFFTYYPLVGELLVHHRPAVLVLLAHLRFFRPPSAGGSRGLTTRNDLLSWIPTAEIQTAMHLPLDTRGMTAPRLLLARLLRYEPLEHALYLVDGARALVAEAEVPWLGPNLHSHPLVGVRAIDLAQSGSDVPITRDQANVRMMGATVRLARQHGVRVIVVGYPVPPSTVGYDPLVYAARFATLRGVVETAGGLFVDLHDALPDEMFADAIGHLTPPGATQLANRLQPIVARELAALRPPRGPSARVAP